MTSKLDTRFALFQWTDIIFREAGERHKRRKKTVLFMLIPLLTPIVMDQAAKRMSTQSKCKIKRFNTEALKAPKEKADPFLS